MKKCTKCQDWKETSEYFFKDKSKGRLHAQCKVCYKAQRAITYTKHYALYGEAYRDRAKARRIRYKQNFHAKMLEYLADKNCEHCGESDNRVLEFDHINPLTKSFSVSQALRYGYSWPETLVEIAKCRILCANCHKKRTALQFNWYKL